MKNEKNHQEYYLKYEKHWLIHSEFASKEEFTAMLM